MVNIHLNEPPRTPQRIMLPIYDKQKQFLDANTPVQAFCGGRGAGKALALDTPILTPSGWSTIGDLKEGDKVYGDDEKECSVVALTEVQIGRPCFSVVFYRYDESEHGLVECPEIIADGEHEWPCGFGQTATTFQLKQILLAGAELHLGYFQLKSVTPVSSVPVKCIEVDSKDHCYLAGDSQIPTHNSFIGAYKIIKMMKPGRFYLIGSPTVKMMQDSTLRSFFAIGKKLDAIRPGSFRSQSGSVVMRSGAEVIFRSAHEPDRFRGPNLSGYWLDEASQMEREAYSNLLPCLRQGEFGDIGEIGFQIATFTPRGTAHWTYEVFARPEDGTDPPRLPANKSLTKATSKENPFLPPEFYDMMYKEIGPNLVPQELDAEFTDTQGSIFKGRWFRYWRRQGDYIWLTDSRGLERSVSLGNCRIFLMVDLASSLKKTADRTAVGVYADDGHGNLIVLDMVAERMESPEITKVIWQKFVQWGAVFVGIEAVGAQMLFIQAEREKGLPVEALQRQKGEDHVGRSVSATVRCEAGQVFFPADSEQKAWWPPMKDELLQFPIGDHDDRVDTLSDAAQWMVRHYKGYGVPLTYRTIGTGVGMQQASGMGAGIRNFN